MCLKDVPLGLKTISTNHLCDAMCEFVYWKLGKNTFIPSPISLLSVRNSRFTSKGKLSCGPCSNTEASWEKGIRVYPFLPSLILLQYKRNLKAFPYFGLVPKLGIQFFPYVQVDTVACGRIWICRAFFRKQVHFWKCISPGDKFSPAILSTSQFLTSLLIICKDIWYCFVMPFVSNS